MPIVGSEKDVDAYYAQYYDDAAGDFKQEAMRQSGQTPYDAQLNDAMGLTPATGQPTATDTKPNPAANQGPSVIQGLGNLTGAVGQGLAQGVTTAINPQTWIGLGQDIAQRGAKETASVLLTNPFETLQNRANAANVGANQFVQNATNTIYNLPGQIGAAYQGTKPTNTNLWALTPEEMAMQTSVGPGRLRDLISAAAFAPDQATQQAALQVLRNDPEYLINMRNLTNSATEAPFTQMIAENPDMLVGVEGFVRGAVGQVGKQSLKQILTSGAKTAALEGTANILSSYNQSLQDVVQQGATGAVAGAGSELLGAGVKRAATGLDSVIKQAMPVQQLEGGVNPTFATGVVGERAEGVTPQAIQQARTATPEQSLEAIYPQQQQVGPATDPLGMGRIQQTQAQTAPVDVTGSYSSQPKSIYGGADPRALPSEASMAGNIRNMGRQMDAMANDYFAQTGGTSAQPSNVFQQYLQQANGDVNAATSMAANDMLERMPPEQRATISVEDWQRQVNQFAEQLRQQQLADLTSYPTNYAQSPTAGADFVGRVDQQAMDAQRAQQQQLLNYPTNYAQSPTAGADFVGRADQQAMDAQRAQQQQLLNYPTNYAQSPTAGADFVGRVDAQSAAPPPMNPLDYQATLTDAVNQAVQTYEAELQRLNAAAQQARAVLTPPEAPLMKGQVTKKQAGQALKKTAAPRRGRKKGPR